MAEMASMAPTAGGQYHWISEFAPRSLQKQLSYLIGWLCVLGWQTGSCIGCFLAGTQIQGLIVLNHSWLYLRKMAWYSPHHSRRLFRRLLQHRLRQTSTSRRGPCPLSPCWWICRYTCFSLGVLVLGLHQSRSGLGSLMRVNGDLVRAFWDLARGF